jgi:hypothetical protein
MRMYEHDYVWGTQDRRRMPEPPGSFLLDLAADMLRRRRAGRRA